MTGGGQPFAAQPGTPTWATSAAGFGRNSTASNLKVGDVVSSRESSLRGASGTTKFPLGMTQSPAGHRLNYSWTGSVLCTGLQTDSKSSGVWSERHAIWVLAKNEEHFPEGAQ